MANKTPYLSLLHPSKKKNIGEKLLMEALLIDHDQKNSTPPETNSKRPWK